MPNNVDLLQKMVNQIQISDAIATLAYKEAQAKANTHKKIAEKIPEVVDTLIKNKRLPEHLREKAAQMLQDPLATLQILSNTASHRIEGEVPAIGSETTSGHKKAASAKGGTGSPFCGGKYNNERESDLILLERMGIR